MYDCKEWLGGLVYEGRIDLKEEIKISPVINHGFQYDDYEEFAKKAKELGIDFHLYGRSDEEFMKVYKDLAIVQKPQPYQKLMMKLSRHDWGLVGNLHPTSEWEIAFPNKMFEYISACVPVVAINAKECEEFLVKEGFEVKDFGAETFDPEDDYPDFIAKAAEAVSKDPGSKAIVLGGSGQGEAIVANKYPNVRAAVYYGKIEQIPGLTRQHNDSNILSLGARFLTAEEATAAVKLFLETPFSQEPRNLRRIEKIKKIEESL